MNIAIANAVRERRIIQFWYKDLMRTLEPHTYGIHKDTNNEVLAGYQTGGFSHSGDLPGWRLYRIDELLSLQVTNQVFRITRTGYNPNDSRMSSIFAKA